MTFKERPVPVWYLNAVGHGWRCDTVSMGWLWPQESYGKNSVRDEQDATCGLLLQCIAFFQTFLLLCLVRVMDLGFILAGMAEENPCHNGLLVRMLRLGA